MARKTELTADDVIDLNKLFTQLEAIDLGKMEKEKTQVEIVEKLENDVTLRRAILTGTKIKRDGRKTRMHWRKRLARRRAYYASKVKPKRDAELLVRLTTPEGWYERITERWRKRDKVTYFTYEEFLEHFWWQIEDYKALLTFRRYDRTVGFELSNIYVIDVREKRNEVVFDGKEWGLRKLGYIL